MTANITFCCFYHDPSKVDSYVNKIWMWMWYTGLSDYVLNKIISNDRIEYRSGGFRALCFHVNKTEDMAFFNGIRCDILAVQKKLTELKRFDEYLEVVLLPMLHSPISVQYF